MDECCVLYPSFLTAVFLSIIISKKNKKQVQITLKTNSDLRICLTLVTFNNPLSPAPQTMLVSLDAGMQESLKEVVSKSLRKLVTQPESLVEDIDDTVLR